MIEATAGKIQPEMVDGDDAQPGWLRANPEIVCVPLLFITVIGLWEGFIRWAEVPIYVVPPPSAIWRSLLQGLGSGLFLTNAFVTLSEAMLGFLGAAITGLLLGSAIAQSRFVERTLYPYLIAIQTTPKVAIAPLFIIWFGFGITSKVIMAGLVEFFPILVNVITGLRSTDVQRIELMQSLRATRWQTFRMVKLPSALPVYGLAVLARFNAWWERCIDPEGRAPMKTYWGEPSMHDVLERTTWHSAQHTRQLVVVLESFGRPIDRPLGELDLQGLPLPLKAWNDDK